jgi:hypothetical protein
VASLPVRVVTLITTNVASRYPLLTGPGRQTWVRVHDVDVLKRQRLGLEDEEVNDSRCDEVAGEENETEGVSDTVIGVRCEETDQEVA